MPTIADLLRTLQFGDSALPVGAFSFSNGLESAVQNAVVHDRDTLRQFVMTAAHQSSAVDGVALLIAHRAAQAGDMQGVIAADKAIYQRKLNDEMRTMTVRMGRKLGELAAHVLESGMTRDWIAHVARGTTPGTYPVGLALVFTSLGLSAREAFAVLHYGVATMILGAALRLMRISFLETQSILLEVSAEADAAYERATEATVDDMASFTPLMDILAASHVKAHVRLFMN